MLIVALFLLGVTVPVAERIFGPKEKMLTPEERETRREEEHLFSELPEVPCLLSSVKDVLHGDPISDSEVGSTSATKKARQEE